MNGIDFASLLFMRWGVIHSVPFLLAIGAAALLLGGCQSTAWQRAGWLPASEEGQSAARSLALDNPRLMRLERAELEEAGEAYELPWYSDRRDYLPVTYDGVQSATYEQSVTVTYDQQVQTGRHVYDYGNITTYRTSTVQTIH